MSRRRAFACVTVILLASVTCVRNTAVPRVLFVGNSLTLANDLPGTVEALSIAGQTLLHCEAIALPGFSLEDHWARGEAQRAIAHGGWSTVVLQQGPSALPESQVLLRDYAGRFAAEARRAGAETALYMVWPSLQRHDDFPGVSQSYAAAARAVHGRLLPVGDAWRLVERRDASIPLYGPDGFHPTPAATYLAALVIYGGLTGRPLASLPSTNPPLRLSVAPAIAATLKAAAADALARQATDSGPGRRPEPS